jgi:hypothetical protein
MTFKQIFALHPKPTDLDHEILLRCIEECLDCSTSRTACADASLSEPDSQDLIGVVRRSLDCADVCEATAQVVTRQSAYRLPVIRAVVDACATACLACAEECERHAAHHEHCRICAEVCRRCKKACDDVRAASPGVAGATRRGRTLGHLPRVLLRSAELKWPTEMAAARA